MCDIPESGTCTHAFKLIKTKYVGISARIHLAILRSMLHFTCWLFVQFRWGGACQTRMLTQSISRLKSRGSSRRISNAGSVSGDWPSGGKLLTASSEYVLIPARMDMTILSEIRAIRMALREPDTQPPTVQRASRAFVQRHIGT